MIAWNFTPSFKTELRTINGHSLDQSALLVLAQLGMVEEFGVGPMGLQLSSPIH
jgi:hypothetical protein